MCLYSRGWKFESGKKHKNVGVSSDCKLNKHNPFELTFYEGRYTPVRENPRLCVADDTT